mgnify:CR=1 FL=1
MIKKEQMINKGSMSKAVTALLKDNLVEVEFTKVNGDLRKMKCTKAAVHIPDDKLPAGNNISKLNEDVIRVYDVDVGDWRSFRADSIKTFRVV